jgi:hypothetical protein
MSDELEGYVGRSAIHVTEREFIRDLIGAEDHVLEVGTLDGVTVAFWARHRPEVRFKSVDPFRPGTGTGAGIEKCWWQNAGPNQELIVGTLEEAHEKLLECDLFNIIFLDGDHSYEACLSDCRNAVQYLYDGGKLIIHDYGRTHLPHLEGVTRAVDEFCAEAGFEVTEVFRTTAVLRRKT